VQALQKASAVWFYGGDQWTYTSTWKGTQVNTIVDQRFGDHSLTVGGTSAGTAILGDWAYSSPYTAPDEHNLGGQEALDNPYGPFLHFESDFLHLSPLANVITDTHFGNVLPPPDDRARMGRLMTFMAFMSIDNPETVKGLGVNAATAVEVESDPELTARVVGTGYGYFLTGSGQPGTDGLGRLLTPLNYANVIVHRVDKTTADFSFLNAWRPDGGVGTKYTITAAPDPNDPTGTRDKLTSTKADGSVY